MFPKDAENTKQKYANHVSVPKYFTEETIISLKSGECLSPWSEATGSCELPKVNTGN